MAGYITSKYTKWYKAKEFYPEKIGYYEVKFKPELHTGMRFWDGKNWKFSKENPISQLATFNNAYWRGLKMQYQEFK